MINNAIVEKIENDCIIVSTVRSGACGGNCSLCGGCKAEKVYTKTLCDFDVNVGDSVKIESNTYSVILAMLAVFILPLILPLVLYLALRNSGTVISVIGVVIGIVISCVNIYVLSHSKDFSKKITPKIVAINNKK